MQLVVTSIKDFLKKLKGVEAASVVYPPTEGSVPRQIPEPSFVGQESQPRHSGLEYAPSHPVCEPASCRIPARLIIFRRNG